MGSVSGTSDFFGNSYFRFMGSLLSLKRPKHPNMAGLLSWLFEGGVKVSSGIVEWYRGSCGTDFDSSDIASPVHGM